MGKFKGLKIFGIIILTIVLFFLTINIIPPTDIFSPLIYITIIAQIS